MALAAAAILAAIAALVFPARPGPDERWPSVRGAIGAGCLAAARSEAERQRRQLRRRCGTPMFWRSPA